MVLELFLKQSRRDNILITPHKAIAAVWGVTESPNKAIAAVWGVTESPNKAIAAVWGPITSLNNQ